MVTVLKVMHTGANTGQRNSYSCCNTESRPKRDAVGRDHYNKEG